MPEIQFRNLLDNVIGRADHLDGSKRTVIGRAQHDQPRDLFSCLRQGHASDQAAHTMGNEAHLGCGFLPDLICQVRSQILEAASPIVWKEIGVEAVNLQPQLQFQIRQQDGARGVIRRCGSIELERCQLAQRDLDRIDPQNVFDAEQALFGKRGSHDTGQDQDARSAANRPRGSIPSQIAKPVIVVGTKVVFEQPPAFAC